jgi:hypothetical protein
MPRLACSLLLLLAACPPPPRFVNTEVLSARGPVEDALIAADCGHYQKSARRSDEDGRTRLKLSGDADASRCMVTVAAPGYRTIETAVANACTAPIACPLLQVWLEEASAALEVIP